MSDNNSTADASNQAVATNQPPNDWQTNEEIAILREYLRIPSVHPNIDYEPCVQFLRRQAAQLDLPMQVFDGTTSAVDAPTTTSAGNQPEQQLPLPSPPPHKPVVVITWPGVEPTLKSIALNSHMDVVPVYRDAWTHPPFAADLDSATGRIYARGAQDMKSVGMQYLAAIRQLRAVGFQPQRTVHVLFVPDEEIGGVAGMLAFTKTAAFESLNIGFALDEGIASATEEFPVFYAERSAWFLHINCPGTTGHGSLLHRNTAGEKVASVLGNFARFRAAEVAKLAANAELTVGDVTTINLTMLSGGVQVNVVPTAMRISFDIRLAVTVQHDDFEQMLRSWCLEAGDDVTIEFDIKSPYVLPTALDATNPFWLAFKKSADELNLRTVNRVFLGATDSRYLRQLGIPAIGFSPINQTPVLLHDNDEYLGADTYLRGIRIYAQILKEVTHA